MMKIDPDPQLKALGQRIKKIRTKNGMSMNALSKKVGVSGGVIANLESGQAKVLHTETRKKIEKFLGKGLSLPAPVRRTKTVAVPSMQEVEEALGLDVNSSATPPVTLSVGRMRITIEVD